MQLTLNDKRFLELSLMSGEDRVEILMAELDGEGTITRRLLATGVTTAHLRKIAEALEAYADMAEAAADAERSLGCTEWRLTTGATTGQL